MDTVGTGPVNSYCDANSQKMDGCYDHQVSREDLPASDGRRARRDRNRAAVVDAMFELVESGPLPPTTEAVAERAGVSVSSIFRYFDSVDDLVREAIETHFDRYADLFEIPSLGIGPLADRVRHLVDARLTLYATIAPIARFARARASEQPQLAESLSLARAGFANQIRAHFQTELARLTPQRAGDLVSLIDTLTSFEAWDLQHSGHQRSNRLVRRTLSDGVTALIAHSAVPD